MDKTKVISVLADLIKTNQERVIVYTNAAASIKDDNELLQLLCDVVKQASGFIKELQLEMVSYDIPVAYSKLPSTKVYKTWSDFDIAFNGQTSRQLLASCEYGEAALEAVYNSALDETGIPANAVIIILNQRREIKATHHKIKKHRDAQLHVEAQLE